MDTKINTIAEGLEEFKKGNFLIVVDDEDRENEGDLVVAAEKITPEMVNFMLIHARGVLCAPVTLSRCKELNLPHQVSDNTSMLGTPFTVTVDKLEGCSTELIPCGGRLNGTPGIGSGMKAEIGVYSHVVGFLTGSNTNKSYNYSSLSVAKEDKNRKIKDAL